MTEPKRSKIENSSCLLFPHRIISADMVLESIDFVGLEHSGTGKCVSVLEQTESHILVRGTGNIKLHLEAVEKGDDRLELLFHGALSTGSYLLAMYSPNLRISSSDVFEYAPYNHKIPLSSCDAFNLIPEDQRTETVEEFSDSCILSRPEFCSNETYRDLLRVLGKAESSMMGPPDFCRLESLSGSEIYTFFSEIDTDGLLFFNPTFICYLESITGLDLGRPSCHPRIVKLEAGSYMMLSEERGDREKEGLDFYWVISPLGSENHSNGSIQYINKESGEVVATLDPIPNTMHLAYRSEGALRFIRYIPKSSQSSLPIYYVTITCPIS